MTTRKKPEAVEFDASKPTDYNELRSFVRNRATASDGVRILDNLEKREKYLMALIANVPNGIVRWSEVTTGVWVGTYGEQVLRVAYGGEQNGYSGTVFDGTQADFLNKVGNVGRFTTREAAHDACVAFVLPPAPVTKAAEPASDSYLRDRAMGANQGDDMQHAGEDDIPAVG